MKRTEAIAYLTRCADDTGTHWSGGRQYPAEECPTCEGTNDAGWLGAPCSRYGRTAADIAPYVWRVARFESRMNGDGWHVSASQLDHLMGLAVNDSEEPQEIVRQFTERASGADIDAMVRGYLECQLWAQRDNDRDDDAMLDASYSVDDIDPDYVESVRDMFAELVTEHPLAVRMYVNHPNVTVRYRDPHGASGNFGHDYYLTREHHGAGFWDRGLGELGRYLTDIAHYAGSADDLWDNGNGVLAA